MSNSLNLSRLHGMNSFEIAPSPASVTFKGERIDEFIGLFTASESRLRAFVLTLVPRWSDAEDIMQQCSLVLWKKFGMFQSGTNFFAWACQIARLEVKEYRKKRGRESALFSEEFVDAVADEAMEIAGELSERQAALQHCIEKLSPSHRHILHIRYDESGSVEGVAKSVNRTVDAVYKTLSRIRRQLFDCVTRALLAGDR